MAIQELGANVSATMPGSAITTALLLPYAIQNAPGLFMTDTTKWYSIAGVFTATGGEEWLTIGCFNERPARVAIPPGTITSYPSETAYSYVDDVYVLPAVEQFFVHDSAICDTGHNIRLASSVSGAESYHWNTADTTESVFVHNAGISWCVAIRNDTITTDTFYLHYNPIPKPVVRDTSICKNSTSPVLRVQGQVRWYMGLNDTIGSPVQPVIDTRNEDTMTLYLATVDGYCQSEKVQVNIYTVSMPEVALGKDIALCRDAQDTLICALTVKASTIYTWNTGDYTPCIKAGAGVYILEARNACGAVTDTLQIKEYACKGCVFMPTAFTPNGDGRNDVFRPVFYCPMTKYNIKIYNRWGQMVYTSATIGEGWNGLVSGKPADVDTYMYLMTAENEMTEVHYEEKGDFLLIR